MGWQLRVIFLDIDGVLNCKKTPNPRNFPFVVDKKLLARLKVLLKRTRAKVVLSSTWRYDPVGIFAAKHGGIPFVDVTPDMPHRPRRDEILAWLSKHPTVKRFVVIDDDDDELDDLPLFQPSSDTGLTAKVAHGVYKYLAAKTDQDMRNAPIKRLLQNVRSALQGHRG
jgi:hypothetical protein